MYKIPLTLFCMTLLAITACKKNDLDNNVKTILGLHTLSGTLHSESRSYASSGPPTVKTSNVTDYKIVCGMTSNDKLNLSVFGEGNTSNYLPVQFELTRKGIKGCNSCVVFEYRDQHGSSVYIIGLVYNTSSQKIVEYTTLSRFGGTGGSSSSDMTLKEN